jgi:hypothetical protein
MNRQHDKQRRRCLRAIDRAGRYLRLDSYHSFDALVALISARNEINRTIVVSLRPQRRRRRATMALFAAVGAVVFIAAPIGLRLLTQDQPAAEGQK